MISVEFKKHGMPRETLSFCSPHLSTPAAARLREIVCLAPEASCLTQSPWTCRRRFDWEHDDPRNPVTIFDCLPEDSLFDSFGKDSSELRNCRN